MDLAAARAAIAGQVSSAGAPCLPYPPDNPSPPIAFIDTLSLDYASGQSFGLPSAGTAVVVACGQRHDMPAATAGLESAAGGVVAALHALPGLRVTGVRSGVATIARTELPAVSYTVEFPVPQ